MTLAIKKIPKEDWKQFTPNYKVAQKKLYPNERLRKAILKAINVAR